jgi:hypothetical protein
VAFGVAATRELSLHYDHAQFSSIKQLCSFAPIDSGFSQVLVGIQERV